MGPWSYFSVSTRTSRLTRNNSTPTAPKTKDDLEDYYRNKPSEERPNEFKRLAE